MPRFIIYLHLLNVCSCWADDMMEKTKYVKIKLNHSEKNKSKGFYLLMTNGNTYSEKEDEFVVERKYLEMLNRNKIDYEEISLLEE